MMQIFNVHDSTQYLQKAVLSQTAKDWHIYVVLMQILVI